MSDACRSGVLLISSVRDMIVLGVVLMRLRSTIWSSSLLLAPFVLRLLQWQNVAYRPVRMTAHHNGRELQSTADCMLACISELAIPAPDRFQPPATNADNVAAAVAAFRREMAILAGPDGDLCTAAAEVATIPGLLSADAGPATVGGVLSRVTMSEVIVGHRFAERRVACLAKARKSSEQTQIALWDSLKNEVVLHFLMKTSATISGFVATVALACWKCAGVR